MRPWSTSSGNADLVSLYAAYSHQFVAWCGVSFAVECCPASSAPTACLRLCVCGMVRRTAVAAALVVSNAVVLCRCSGVLIIALPIYTESPGKRSQQPAVSRRSDLWISPARFVVWCAALLVLSLRQPVHRAVRQLSDSLWSLSSRYCCVCCPAQEPSCCSWCRASTGTSTFVSASSVSSCVLCAILRLLHLELRPGWCSICRQQNHSRGEGAAAAGATIAKARGT